MEINNKVTRDIKPSKVITVAAAAFLIIISISLYSCICYSNSIKEVQKQTQRLLEYTIKNIEVKNADNNKFIISVSPDISENITKITNEEYNNFLVHYNERQSHWLNMWLTILSLALAFLGLIAPICFMKLYEDKKNEMDKIIDETVKQKEQARLSVDRIQQQLEEVNLKSENLSCELNAAKKYEAQMSKDLMEVKKYVNEARAMSKYTEAFNKMYEGKQEEAKDLFVEAYSLFPDDDRILDAVAINVYYKDKLYDTAIEFLLRAIKINPLSHYHYELSYIYEKKQDYENAICEIKEAINLASSKHIKYLYLSQLAVYYGRQKDIENAKKAINDVIGTGIKHHDIELNIAVAYILIEEYNAAIPILEGHIANNATLYDCYNLAEAYIMVRDFDKASRILKKYLNLKKTDKTNSCNLKTEDYENWINFLVNSEPDDKIQELIKIINDMPKA